jgi:dinuclear metal center YbgI/SA1388 family protein
MKTRDLIGFLDDFLEIHRFGDYAPNGMQVETNPETHSIALGVSASLAFFRRAKKANAQTAIVHHGIFWKGADPALTGVQSTRVGFLYKNDINLAAYHLPLDSHPLVGNNACIADRLGLRDRLPFARHGGEEIGLIGRLPRAEKMERLVRDCRGYFGQINHALCFGKKSVRTVAVVSGGAASDVMEARRRGADLFITGEIKEPLREWCRETRMNYLAAGHYASEKFGIQKLGEVITEKFNLPARFIDIPNPL